MIAAFATTVPSKEFRVETNGCGEPVGQARYAAVSYQQPSATAKTIALGRLATTWRSMA